MTDPKPQVSVSVICQRELLLFFENFVKNLLLNWLYFFLSTSVCGRQERYLYTSFSFFIWHNPVDTQRRFNVYKALNRRRVSTGNHLDR